MVQDGNDVSDDICAVGSARFALGESVGISVGSNDGISLVGQTEGSNVELLGSKVGITPIVGSNVSAVHHE